MREQTFEARFGELRSVLQGEASQEGFDVVVGVLSSMSRQEPERFEAEVLPYAQAGLERWYVARPMADVRWQTPLMVTGRVAEAAVRQGAAWLAAVRELGLMGLSSREVAAGLAAPGREGLYGRLEALSLRLSPLPAPSIEAVLACGWASRLALLNLCGVAVGDGLARLPGESLRVLDVSQASMSEASARALAGFEGLEQLDCASVQVDMIKLLQAARWPRLGSLSLSLHHLHMVSGVPEALGSAPWVVGLRQLVLSGSVRGAAAIEGVVARAQGLEELEARTNGAAWPLERLLGGERGARLRRLAVSEVSCAGALEGGEALEVVELGGAQPEALRALCGHGGLARLRGLTLAPVSGQMPAMVEAMAGARGLEHVRGFEIGANLTPAELERIVAGGALAGVEELRLWRVWQLELAHLHALERQRAALPNLSRVLVTGRRVKELRAQVAGTWLEGKVAETSDAMWWR